MNPDHDNGTPAPAGGGSNGPGGPGDPVGLSSIERRIIEAEVIEAIQTCYDPEIPVNIYELGLVYGVEVDPKGSVTVKMAPTSPHCPAAQSLPSEVASKVKGVKGVTGAAVDIVWEPPWNPGMMTEAARLQLGMM